MEITTWQQARKAARIWAATNNIPERFPRKFPVAIFRRYANLETKAEAMFAIAVYRVLVARKAGCQFVEIGNEHQAMMQAKALYKKFVYVHPVAWEEFDASQLPLEA